MSVSQRSAFCVALLVASATASAQEPAPLRQAESIPYELAAALMSAGSVGGDPQILVGEIPGWVTNRIVVPAGARVVGSATSGGTVVAILAFPPNADSALVDLKRELMKKGWLNPPPQTTYNGGGFRPASSAPSALAAGTAFRFTVCNDQQLLTGTAARRRGATMEVTLRLGSGGQYSPCHPPQFPFAQNQPPRPSQPVLYNPQGVTEMSPTSPECTDPRFSSAQTWTNYKSTMTGDALLDHYVRQLQDSGWKATATLPTVVSRALTRPDSTGTPLETTLIVTVPAQQPTCRQITMYTLQIKKP